jgi:hypothetical protein
LPHGYGEVGLFGRWSLVVGRWSLVVGRWSLVFGLWSLASDIFKNKKASGIPGAFFVLGKDAAIIVNRGF